MVRRAVAEALGTVFLLAAVVGSGIMGEQLADGKARGLPAVVTAEDLAIDPSQQHRPDPHAE